MWRSLRQASVAAITSPIAPNSLSVVVANRNGQNAFATASSIVDTSLIDCQRYLADSRAPGRSSGLAPYGTQTFPTSADASGCAVW